MISRNVVILDTTINKLYLKRDEQNILSYSQTFHVTTQHGTCDIEHAQATKVLWMVILESVQDCSTLTVAKPEPSGHGKVYM